jgi:hypothetical protein
VVPQAPLPKKREQYGTKANAEDWAVFDAMLSKHTKDIQKKKTNKDAVPHENEN